jgi:SrtB family sortase
MELKAEYPEVVGWIYFENENISYPIMYSGDNDKYLRTTYTGEKAKAGAIFIDGESTPDFTDPHSLIYGHNMRDLSMFGRLRYYLTNPDYYQDHQYFQISTEDKVYRYQIFAYEEVADNHDVFWVFGKEPKGYYKMLKEIEQGSYCNSGITTNESDHVITLATCTNKDEERLLVSAVRMDEYEYVQ